MPQSELNPTVRKDIDRAFARMVTLIIGAVNTARLYSQNHPRIGQYIQQAFEEITAVLDERSSTTILNIDEDIVVDNRRLIMKGPHLGKFIRILKEKQIEGLTIAAGLSRKELLQLVMNLSSRSSETVASTACITVGKVGYQNQESNPAKTQNRGPVSREEIESMQSVRDDKLDRIKEVYGRVGQNEQVDIGAIEVIITEFIHRFRRDINPLALLASVKASDDYTFTHVVNVCILTMFLAETLGFTGEHLHRIGIAAALHDIGKLFIPDDIINKPGKLTGREWEIIAQHPLRGAQHLLDLESIPRLAVLCCLEHHVRIDGKGYPEVPTGYQLNIISQMISIADAFDAMRSRRVYRDPLPLPRVIKILQQEKAKAFNPRLVDLFLDIVERKMPEYTSP